MYAFRDNSNVVKKAITGEHVKVNLIKGIFGGVFLSLLVTIPFDVYAAQQEQGGTAQLVQQFRPPPPTVEKDKIFVENYFEPGHELQGNKTGQWWENSTYLGVTHKNITGYGYLSEYSRFSVQNYTLNAGVYINIDKDQYVHLETGGGWDVSYVYEFQTIAEYAHRLYKGLFWQAGYNYRGYPKDDSHIVYPGLMYYFGDHWMSANFGTNWIESRETTYFGTVKGNFVITDRVQLWSGVAFGQRLYDIFGVKGEDGVILFGGVTVRIYKDLNLKVGCSYGQEDPKFIKRSMIFDLSSKF